MEEDAPARRVFDAGVGGSRRRGGPCIRWKDQIEETLSSILSLRPMKGFYERTQDMCLKLIYNQFVYKLKNSKDVTSST